jgi:hypothetical protein
MAGITDTLTRDITILENDSVGGGNLDTSLIFLPYR